MKNVLIVGYGIVGKNLSHEIRNLHPDIYDKYKTELNTKKSNKVYDFAFICVDTPYIDENIPCDLKEVKNAIFENEAEIYLIKSTILPGSIENLIEETGKKIIFSPEYYGSTHFSNNYVYNFTILGGEKAICKKAIQLLQNVYDGRHRFIVVDSRAAELVKYMENAYLAMKVSFCSQFWNIAKEIDVDYEMLRELFISDPRINPSNTFIFDEHPYWESHCYDKDLAAFSSVYDAPLIEAVISFNEMMKNKYKK